MERYEISDASAYETWIKGKIKLDATKLLPLPAGKSVFMVIAQKDTCVPTSTQYRLWRELGKPEKREISTHHVAAVMRSYFLYHNDIEEFIVGKLENRR